MRVAVVFFSKGASGPVVDVARALAGGIERQGHDVDIVNADTDRDQRLTGYGYIVVGTGPASFFGGKLPDSLSTFLSRAGTLTGKKSFAFVTRTLFGSQRAVLRLMAALEHEGMFVKNSRVLRSATEAAAIGERLEIAT